jgi:hypothetical protein
MHRAGSTSFDRSVGVPFSCTIARFTRSVRRAVLQGTFKAVAIEFARAGADVVVNYIRGNKIDDAYPTGPVSHGINSRIPCAKSMRLTHHVARSVRACWKRRSSEGGHSLR